MIPEPFVFTEEKIATITAFSSIIKDYRKDAINGKRTSGVEKDWEEDEAFYEGCDFLKNKTLKSPSQSGPLLEMKPPKEGGTRSTVFLKITRPYCDAAAARVADMLLPTDERNWALRPSPISDLIQGPSAEMPSLQGMAVAAPPQQNAPAPQGQPAIQPPGQAPGMLRKMMSNLFGSSQAPVEAPEAEQVAPPPGPPPISPEEIALKEAKDRCERAQTQIDDWHIAGRYHAEVRKVIETCARLGTGILKGPVGTKKKSKAVIKDELGMFGIKMKEETIPQSYSISPWNLWPDPNCGDNIQNGAWVFENAEISARRLRDLISTDPTVPSGYLDEQILKCLEEGPSLALVDGHKKTENYQCANSDLFEIWYFHGMVSVKDMEAAGCKVDGALKHHYPCQVTMVNDRIIKISMSPLDSGEFPYDVMVWQSRVNHWAGVGVARQMRECQKGANAAVRNMMDNAGLSAGPMVIVDQSKVVPANGKFELTPRKIWYKAVNGEDVGDVRTAFHSVVIDSRQAELMNIIQFWLKQAEDTTGLPMLMQGQQGKAPDTAHGMTIVNNNGNTILRRIARTFDDLITEPHIGRYYEWLLIHGPDNAKGDFTLDARGSSALVERDMQNQAMAQLANAALNPAFELDPVLIMRESLKGIRIDPKKVSLSDEKKRELASRQPPPDPRVQVAEMNLQGKQAETQAKLQAAAAEADKDRSLDQWMADMDHQIAISSLSLEEKKIFNEAKFKMAETVMKLNVQQKLTKETMHHDKDLSTANHMVSLHKIKQDALVAPTEPAGKAKQGESFVS